MHEEQPSGLRGVLTSIHESMPPPFRPAVWQLHSQRESALKASAAAEKLAQEAARRAGARHAFAPPLNHQPVRPSCRVPLLACVGPPARRCRHSRLPRLASCCPAHAAMLSCAVPCVGAGDKSARQVRERLKGVLPPLEDFMGQVRTHPDL